MFLLEGYTLETLCLGYGCWDCNTHWVIMCGWSSTTSASALPHGPVVLEYPVMAAWFVSTLLCSLIVDIRIMDTTKCMLFWSGIQSRLWLWLNYCNRRSLEPILIGEQRNIFIFDCSLSLTPRKMKYTTDYYIVNFLGFTIWAYALVLFRFM